MDVCSISSCVCDSQDCPTCHGDGGVHMGAQRCRACQGKGFVHNSNMTHDKPRGQKCFFCKECSSCRGKGVFGA